MAVRIHAIRTGSVRMRRSALAQDHSLLGLVRPMLGGPWSDWLPIGCWAIEHPDGLVLVDTGESAKVMHRGYLPRAHPYFQNALDFDVRPEDELGPQLQRLGLGTPRTLVLTHLHADHTGGLGHVEGVPALVDQAELDALSGLSRRLNGYLPHLWPASFAPQPIPWTTDAVGPFERSYPVTSDGAITVLPAPGHTPGHVVVLVDDGERRTLIASDAAYEHRFIETGTSETLRRIRALQADAVLLSHAG